MMAPGGGRRSWLLTGASSTTLLRVTPNSMEAQQGIRGRISIKVPYKYPLSPIHRPRLIMDFMGMCEAANGTVGTLVILQPASVTCYHSGDPGPKAWSRTTCSMSKLNQIEDTISSMFPRLSFHLLGVVA